MSTRRPDIRNVRTFQRDGIYALSSFRQSHTAFTSTYEVDIPTVYRHNTANVHRPEQSVINFNIAMAYCGSNNFFQRGTCMFNVRQNTAL